MPDPEAPKNLMSFNHFHADHYRRFWDLHHAAPVFKKTPGTRHRSLEIGKCKPKDI